MGLFGPRLPIDSDELEFQFATFKWLRGALAKIHADVGVAIEAVDLSEFVEE